MTPTQRRNGMSLSKAFTIAAIVCVTCQVLYFGRLLTIVDIVERERAASSNATSLSVTSEDVWKEDDEPEPLIESVESVERSTAPLATIDSTEPLPTEPLPTEPSTPPPVNLTPAMHQVQTSTRFQDLFDLQAPPFDSIFPTAPRGIVMSMHNAMVPIGVSLIRELRSLGNHDPIQVMHCFPEELSQRAHELIVAADPDNVEIIDACQVLVNSKVLTTEAAKDFQNFWLKPLAVVLSTFNQVMLMDVDNIFLRNPSDLWSSQPVLDTGALFFHDRVLNFNFWLNQAMGDGRSYLSTFLETFPLDKLKLKPYTGPSQQLLKSEIYARHTAHEQDSSVVLIDKERAGTGVLRVLWYLATVQRYHERPFSWGDKEAFWLSFELAQVPYRFSPWAASVVSRPDDMSSHEDTLCGSLAQYFPNQDGTDDLVFVNGGEVIDIVEGLTKPFNNISWPSRGQMLLQNIPQYVTPRHVRHATKSMGERGSLDQTCLIGDGAVPIPKSFEQIARRRIHSTAETAMQMVWT